MKRFYTILLVLLTLGQFCNAQQNPTMVYVKVDGQDTGLGTGGYFSNPISPDQLMNNVYNGMYSGDVEIYFAGGDYYTDFTFYNIPNTIQSISIYGGWNPTSRRINFNDRDFENYETRFHAAHGPSVWFEAVGHNHINGWKTCFINGITFTSDDEFINYPALKIVGGSHVISQCKFEHVFSSDILIWLETGGNIVNFVNCLFDNNDVSNLIALCSHVNLINVTIADNYFQHYAFISFQSQSTPYIYNLRNSIIYGNANTSMNGGRIHVSHSILENYDDWIDDVEYNEFGVDPIFTYHPTAPYSCDIDNSPAIDAGNSSYIVDYFTNGFNLDIVDYDIANQYRYGDNNYSMIDIGAYQNVPEYSLYYSERETPIMRKNNKNMGETPISIYLWSDLHMLYVNNLYETMTTLVLYNLSGQSCYSTSLQKGMNALPIALTTGMYIAKITSKEGDDLISKSIVIK